MSNSDVLDGFKCGGCHHIAAPPAVLSCGHVVCARADGWSSCPVDGCVGRSVAGASLAVCGLIDSILQAEVAGYGEARARGCTAPVNIPAVPISDPLPAPAAAASDGAAAAGGAAAQEGGAGSAASDHVEEEEDPASLVGNPVEVHSLTSTAGRSLNGLRGTVEEHDAAGGRFVVLVHNSRASSSRRVRARAANLRRLVFPYIHFGVGCDGCGVYPIEGRRFRCTDCSEAMGFDMCGACHAMGFHLRSDSGRFNQQHTPEHTMEEMPHVDTVLHQLQRAHPELSVEEIMERVTAHQQAQA